MSIGPKFISFCNMLREVGYDLDEYPGKMWHDIFVEITDKSIPKNEVQFVIKDYIFNWTHLNEEHV